MTATLTEASPPAAPATNEERTPHVFLFGMPEAGKTALLGALSRVAETQERLLGGRVSQAPESLREIQRQLYSQQLHQTRDEIREYALRIEPFRGAQPDPSRAFDVVVIDCDGRMVSDLVHDATKTQQYVGQGPLVDAIRRAHALIMVVDGAAPDDWVATDFTQFAKFLRWLRYARGWQAEVAAYPVTLVVAKCDRLARPGDTAAVWTERIEARKEEVVEQFKEFLDREDAALFGGLAFHSMATAIGLPELANLQARPDDPLGVAELFRDSFGAAVEFHQRCEQARKKLRGTMFGLLGLVVMLVLFAVVLNVTRNMRVASPLAAALDVYRAHEAGPPSGHLAGSIPQRIEDLAGFAGDPLFRQLAGRDQKFVTDRLGELRAYQEYQSRLRAIDAPAEARDLEELEAIESRLRERAAVPEEFQEAWAQSDAVKLRTQRLADAAAIRAGVAQATEKFDQSRQAVEKQYLFTAQAPKTPIDWRVWGAATDKLLADVTAPIRPDEPLPGCSEGVTYATALAYPEAKKAAERWATAKQKLATLNDIARAVSLTSPNGSLHAVDGFTIDRAPSWWADLQTRHPHAAAWSQADLPDAALADIRAAAAAEYERLLPPMRAAVAAAYARTPGNVESPTKWNSTIGVVRAQPPARACNDIAQITRRLAGIEPADPLKALVDFVAKEQFTIDVHTVRLTLPDELGGEKLTPKSPWILGMRDISGAVVNHRFQMQSASERDDAAKTTTYTFVMQGYARIDYSPGDTLWAEIDVADATDKMWKLTWWGSAVRSRLFQFDRLNHAPLLHRKTQKSDEGEPANGVKLEIRPANGLPKLPDLMP